MFESVFELFEKQLKTYELFTDDDFAMIRSHAIVKKISKREFLLRQGSVCKYHTFVCTGCLRSYRIDDAGVEHIFNLSSANRWVCDRVSLSSGEPSFEFIDALEDSTVVQFSAASFEQLLERIPNFNVLNTMILTEDNGSTRERVYMMLSLQAEERYRQFIQNFPQLHSRLPIYMIASYLGISRETLTRIRGNMVELRKPCKINS